MKPFQLVIFDCDGVLVDSEPITTGVMAAMLQEMGVLITADALYQQVHGRSLAQCLAVLTERLGRPLPEDFVLTLRQRAAAALWAEVKPIPGVAEALAHLSIPVTVASSGEREKMLLTLGRAGLLPRFGNNIYSTADVSHPKPAPDIYLHAARQNGVAPHACAVVEDSPAGVQAGVAAGMTVFGYAATTPAHRLKEAGAHVVFGDMAELPALLV